MKLTLTLTKKDLESLRSLESAVKRQYGNVYVGTNNFCVYFDYPKELCALLRPAPGNTFLDSAPLKELLTKLDSGETLNFEVESSLPDKK
jgi:hypothetical protein